MVTKLKEFTFIDLFAGIGGFHLALHALGGRCVFASEIDSYARKTYEHNFHKISPKLFENGMYNNDIRTISPKNIPDFDILCGGFPCQPFSQAGFKRGFDDNLKSERGNLFFNIAEIIDEKRPKAFFLENVRGIVNHDGGNTLKVIRGILEDELGYSFYLQVVKASDYGLPQLRPRAFMIGFRDEGFFKSFTFPEKQPLRFNMSDVWGGKCSREIGFTLRVGGRGSNINDRRNWDHYLVDGEVRKLMPEQGRKMQGLPDWFEFPVPSTQAMKQLGNSVAVDAVNVCAASMLDHMFRIETRQKNINNNKNKGEWTELYTFLKTIVDKKLLFADKKLNVLDPASHFTVTKVSTLNILEACLLTESDEVIVENEHTHKRESIFVSSFLNAAVLKDIVASIKAGSRTFAIPQVDVIQGLLGISIIKGGTSRQKADIVLDVKKDGLVKHNEGFGIKSYLGSKPTLLNASGNTNFVFRIDGLEKQHVDSINSINSRTKLMDRLNAIDKNGGVLSFEHTERPTMQYNLELVDSEMPKIIALMLLEFYLNRTSLVEDNIANVYATHFANTETNRDLQFFQVKVKRLLVGALLGFFAGSKWDGKYIANGTIIVKENGEQVGFHIIESTHLEDYLFEHIKFDTPSTTRHRFGRIITERNGQLFFKLNLQLRFK